MDTLKKLTKADRRKMQLDRHYKALEALAAHLGIDNPNGKKLSVALLKLEREAHQAAEYYCNGVDASGNRFEDDKWEAVKLSVYDRVHQLFSPIKIGEKGYKPRLTSFFVNGDPRGCALKLNNETEAQRELIEKTGLQRDWGGYGLLAPEITGN